MRVNAVSSAMLGYECGTKYKKTGLYNSNPVLNNQNNLKLNNANTPSFGIVNYDMYPSMKKPKFNLKKIISDNYNYVKRLVKNEPQPDHITMLLDGKRDAEAVKFYKAYRAEEKLASLRNRILNDEFKDKPAEVYKHLIENEKNLEKTARYMH